MFKRSRIMAIWVGVCDRSYCFYNAATDALRVTLGIALTSVVWDSASSVEYKALVL